MDENIVSITQFSNYIKSIFEAEYLLQNICVYGEVSSYNISNGIAYFTLKDENALLNCVMFNPKEKPNIGDVIIAKGSPNYYVKGGRFSFNVTSIMPYGKGVLYEKFLLLKSKLEKLGYFDLNKKKPLPARVKRIGVVTSATGAVIQDIIDVTKRRNNSVDIVLYPVKVQGIGAELEIANGINVFSNYDNVDVVIVARGGGSIEDLQPFNTEIVADAVYNCKKPLVSAVGHETDFTIIDFCSDLRAPTPSAAAELVVSEKTKDFDTISNLLNRIEDVINLKVNAFINEINLSIENIYKSVKNILNLNRLKVENQTTNLNASVNGLLLNTENKLNILNNKIEQLNPKSIIDKGYIKAKINGKNLSSYKNVNVNDEIVLELIDGNINTKVLEVKGK